MSGKPMLVLDDLEVGGTMTEASARRFIGLCERYSLLDVYFPPRVVIGPLPLLDRMAQAVCNWSAALQRAHVRAWCKAHGVDCPWGYIDHVRSQSAKLRTPWTQRPDCTRYPRAEVRDGNGSTIVIVSTRAFKQDLFESLKKRTKGIEG